MQKIASFFWLLPFIFFWFGYRLISYIMHIEQFATPTLIGLTLDQALPIVSEHHLNIRILAHQETNNFPEGTILAQQPKPQQLVKPHQALYITLAKKQQKPQAPKLIGLSEKELTTIAKNNMLKIKIFSLESTYPLGTCFAQYPAPQEELLTNTIIAYISAGLCATRLLPDLKNKSAEEVTQFFYDYGIKTQVFSNPVKQSEQLVHQEAQCITDQKPIAGSIIHLAKPLTIQLKTE